MTTHFLEETDYCDWVCFIDAGRLIANAAPEELRRRYSDGYRVDIEAAPGERDRLAALLPGGRIEATPSGLQLVLPTLEPGALAALERLVADHPGTRVHIEQPPMTDVFRRVLAERATSGGEP